MHEFFGHMVGAHANYALALGEVLVELGLGVVRDLGETGQHFFDFCHRLLPLLIVFHDFEQALDTRVVLLFAEVTRIGLIAVERNHGNV